MENGNPYFDPDPQIYFIVLKIIGFLTIPISILGLYCVIKKTPRSRSGIGTFFVIHVIIISTIFEINLTFLSPPLIYLPYIAVEFRGILTWLGVLPEIQLEILITTIAGAFASIVPVIYYRMDIILSSGHIVNHFLVKAAIYATVFGAAYILPVPLIALCVQNQLETKTSAERMFQVRLDGLWKAETLVFQLGMDNFFTIVVAATAAGGMLGGNAILFVCGYIIHHTIRTKAAEMAVGNTRNYQSFVGTVTTILVLFMLIIGFICPTIGLLFLFHSYRADMMNVAIIFGASVVPITLATYLLTYKPYGYFIMTPVRRLLWFLRRRRPSVASIHNAKMRPIK